MLSSSPVDTLAFVGWMMGLIWGGQLDLKPVSVALCALGFSSVWGLCSWEKMLLRGLGISCMTCPDIACAFMSVISHKWVIKARPDSRAGAVPFLSRWAGPIAEEQVEGEQMAWQPSAIAGCRVQGSGEVAVNVHCFLCIDVILVSGNMEWKVGFYRIFHWPEN